MNAEDIVSDIAKRYVDDIKAELKNMLRSFLGPVGYNTTHDVARQTRKLLEEQGWKIDDVEARLEGKEIKVNVKGRPPMPVGSFSGVAE